MSQDFDFREKFLEMFSDNYIKEIPDGADICSECKGIGWKSDYHNIFPCEKCYGKGYEGPQICAKCGKSSIERGHTIECGYTICNACRYEELEEKDRETKQQCYEKATKITFDEYDGKFWDDSWTHIKDKDDLEEWIIEQMEDGEDYPTWMWATDKENCLDISLSDIILNACEDEGYEGMYENLDIEALMLIEESLNAWIKEQGDMVYTYYENYNIVVDLGDLISEIKERLNKRFL